MLTRFEIHFPTMFGENISTSHQIERAFFRLPTETLSLPFQQCLVHISADANP